LNDEPSIQWRKEPAVQKSLDRLFLDFSVMKLEQLTSRIVDCLGKLRDDRIWARESENQNAVGNLVLHLCGNIGQWIVTGIGGAPDTRDRECEFATRGGAAGTDLAALLRSSVEEAVQVLNQVTAARLGDPIRVQAYDTTVLAAIYHVVEHFSQHAGQIMYATKLATGQDLGYYRHLTRPSHKEKTP
jgi:uncharacterized damage-inducible protein DinB